VLGVVPERAFEETIWIAHLSLATHVVHLKVTLIEFGAVSKFVCTESIFETILIIAFIPRPIKKGLTTFSLLNIVGELAFECYGSLSVFQNTVAMLDSVCRIQMTFVYDSIVLQELAIVLGFLLH
jgi:hypothetical protein